MGSGAFTSVAVFLSPVRDKLNGVDKERCPECGAVEVVPIVYGYPAPDSELMRAAEAGEVFLGGCVIQDDQPYWRCRNCGFEGPDGGRIAGWPDTVSPLPLKALPL